MAGNLDFRLNLLANTTGLQQGMNGAKFAVNALVAAMAAVGVGVSVSGLVSAADSYTNLSARINIATKDGGDFASAMAGVHQVALMTNSSLEATGSLFTRLNAVAKDMGMSQQQALDLTKTVTQAIQVGGGSAQASEAAVQQFIQAMQGGVLRGEEFNSIMENGYGLAEALAKGLGVTTGELRKMAENGELSSERVIKAVSSQATAIQATYDQFPTTIGNAMQRISTSWEILIGKMDQANGSSATVAQWLVTLADNISELQVFIDDIGEGFVWIGYKLQSIDPSTISTLKSLLSEMYETVKSNVSSVADFGETIWSAFTTALDSVSPLFAAFMSGKDDVSGLEVALNILRMAFAAISDVTTGFNIGLKLLLSGIQFLSGGLYALSAQVLDFLGFDTLAQQALNASDRMFAQAEKNGTKAVELAEKHKWAVVKTYEDIGKTQEQKNAEAVASSKASLDKLLADQSAEAAGKKASEDEKLKAVQEYAEAAISANGGVMDGVMQADLMTKGYIVTMDQAGKVSTSAWDAASSGADKVAISADKARKAGTALGLDLDVALNRVSEKFAAGQRNLNEFSAGLDKLGVKGEQAGNVTYLAWQKWLGSAKNQAEIDAAKAKLIEFEEQGVFSTKQVEMGMAALRSQAKELPGDIDPVTESFKRLGIETRENLKIAAQEAMMDFINVKNSGKATAEGIEQAHKKAAQAVALSGDAGVIAAFNAADASQNLKIQIDETGKASVQSMDEWTEANHRVRDSAGGISDGYREAGAVAREEAKSASDAWQEAINAASQEFNAEMNRQGKALGSSIYGYSSYSRGDVVSQIRSLGYDEDEAKNLASSIWSKGLEADRDAKSEGMGKGGNPALNLLIEQEFNSAAAKGLTTQHGTNKINDLLRQLAGGSMVARTSAPTVSTPSAPRTVQNNISINGKTISIPVTEDRQGDFDDFLSELEKLKKAM